MLLMTEKGMFDMQKLITNTWKIIKKVANRHIFNIGMCIIYIDTSQFNEDFIKKL